jgi:hypothetical protein
MGWRDLLPTGDESLVAPWLDGRELQSGDRTWTIDGKLPREIGWYTFKINGRKAKVGGPSDPATETLKQVVHGYLVGDRIVLDDAHVDPNPAKIVGFSEPVALLDRGLDRFARIVAGRPYEDGPLIFVSQAFPLGCEDAVTRAFQNRAPSVEGIPNVPPALDAAFRMESWSRADTERRRAEMERQRAEEKARRQLEERRRQLEEQVGTAAGRRALAQVDFAEGAKAALRVAGAEYLDHKKGYARGEMVVTFRFLRRVFVCSCDEKTLRIIDAGICLVDHRTGEKGDTRFTLESLPGVIGEAHRTGVLVVNHRDGNYDED